MVISSLLKVGYKVVCITPNADKIQSAIKHNVDFDKSVQFFELKNFTSSSKKQPSQTKNALPNFYVNNDESSLFRRLRKRIAHFLAPPLKAEILNIEKSIMKLIHEYYTVDARDPATTAGVRSQITTMLASVHWPIDFLFFMYVDMLPHYNRYWRGKTGDFLFPWGGICFNHYKAISFALQHSAYFKKTGFKGLCIPGATACKELSRIVPDKIFACIPDITNTDMPENASVLLTQLRNKAAGRKIVLMSGSIESRKNIQTFCQLAQLADPGKWFFAIVGKIHNASFSSGELDSIMDSIFFLLTESRDNFFVYNNFLKDEKDLNSIINESSVLFCAYRDFKGSSNMLSKAAYFDKPIIVSKGYIMEAMVEKYRIGVCVPEDNAAAVLAALERVIETPPPPENFAAYRADYNEDVMGSDLEKFINNCLQDEKQA